jgi:hypothetical protein
MKTLVGELNNTVLDSVAQMRGRISNVRYGKVENDQNVILFSFDGIPHKGILRGRNNDLVLGFGAEQDKAIALRVFLDGNSEKL